MIPLENFLALSAILFGLGVYGVLARRNAVLILMSIELMLNAVSLNFAAFASYLDETAVQGAVFAVFVITVAAAEVGLALAIVIRLFRLIGGSNVDEAATMRW
jgi:NADH:ubiquinone oxidoreductase subunit K